MSRLMLSVFLLILIIPAFAADNKPAVSSAQPVVNDTQKIVTKTEDEINQLEQQNLQLETQLRTLSQKLQEEEKQIQEQQQKEQLENAFLDEKLGIGMVVLGGLLLIWLVWPRRNKRRKNQALMRTQSTPSETNSELSSLPETIYRLSLLIATDMTKSV